MHIHIYLKNTDFHSTMICHCSQNPFFVLFIHSFCGGSPAVPMRWSHRNRTPTSWCFAAIFLFYPLTLLFFFTPLQGVDNKIVHYSWHLVDVRLKGRATLTDMYSSSSSALEDFMADFRSNLNIQNVWYLLLLLGLQLGSIPNWMLCAIAVHKQPKHTTHLD